MDNNDGMVVDCVYRFANIGQKSSINDIRMITKIEASCLIRTRTVYSLGR